MCASAFTKYSAPTLAALLVLSGLSGCGSAAEDAEPIAEATYKCDGGKSIDATFYEELVELTLSDERSMTLPQAVSASGARYANKDESFVFWTKGDTAFVTEGDEEKETFANCVAQNDVD